jgi:hypothetical protein
MRRCTSKTIKKLFFNSDEKRVGMRRLRHGFASTHDFAVDAPANAYVGNLTITAIYRQPVGKPLGPYYVRFCGRYWGQSG